jgi:hypothetical protein
MARALLVLHNDDLREKAVRWIRGIPKDSRVEFKGPKRTLPQNDKMWALLTEVSEQVEWYGQKLTTDDWKDVFTASLRKARIVPALDGNGFVQLGLHTSDFDKDEMANMIELIYSFGAERGVEFRETTP